jgi:hypothetical protein
VVAGQRDWALAERLDVGIKLKGHSAEGRLEPAGAWNEVVSHRVRIADPKEIDASVLRAPQRGLKEVAMSSLWDWMSRVLSGQTRTRWQLVIAGIVVLFWLGIDVHQYVYFLLSKSCP